MLNIMFFQYKQNVMKIQELKRNQYRKVDA